MPVVVALDGFMLFADQDQDGFAETVKVIASDLTMPSGIAIKDNQLYIAAVDTIYQTGPLDEVLLKPVTLSPVFHPAPQRQTPWLEIHRFRPGWLAVHSGGGAVQHLPV